MDTTLEEKLQNEVERWKKYLLDFTRKNALLYSKIGEARGLAEIVTPEFHPTLNKIAFEDTPLYFPYKRDLLELEPSEPLASIPLSSQLARCVQSKKHQSNFLYTSLEDDRLKSRLNGFRRRSLEAQQEKGFNVLYSTFGSLRWKETNDASEFQSAPLLVLPVKLSNSSKEPYFRIERIEDTLQFNPTLREFLHKRYGFHLPELPEFDTPQDVEDWLEDTEKTLQDETGNPLFHSWKVERRVGLGLLSFAKIEIYEDLNQHTPEILANPLCREIAGSGELFHSEPSHDTSAADGNYSPEDVYTIRDSDSSQLEALLAVQRGQNIVLDGPPGTGKSQTIANIIADCLAHGKRVLFVSEKLVALEVVKKWLDAENLGDFCLNCHDTKQPRKAIIHELERCMNLGRISQPKSEQMFTDLKERVSQLNRYAELLHEPQGAAERTARQVMEELFLLEKTPKNTMWRIEDPLEIPESRCESWKNLVREFQENFQSCSDTELPWNPEFAWFDAPIRELENTEKSDFFLSVERLQSAYRALLENQTTRDWPFLSTDTECGKFPENFAKLGKILELDFEFSKEWFENSPRSVMDLFERTTEELRRREELQRSQAEAFRFDGEWMEDLNSSEVASRLEALYESSAWETWGIIGTSQTTLRPRIAQLQQIAQILKEKYLTPLFELQAVIQKWENTFNQSIFTTLGLQDIDNCAKVLQSLDRIQTYNSQWDECLNQTTESKFYNLITIYNSYLDAKHNLESNVQIQPQFLGESGFAIFEEIQSEYKSWRKKFMVESWNKATKRFQLLKYINNTFIRLNDIVEKFIQITGLSALKSATLSDLQTLLPALENFTRIRVFDMNWIPGENPADVVLQRKRRELSGTLGALLLQSHFISRFRTEAFSDVGLKIMTEPLKNASAFRKLFFEKKLHEACEDARAYYFVEPETDDEVIQDAKIFQNIFEIWTSISDLFSAKDIAWSKIPNVPDYLESMMYYDDLEQKLARWGGIPRQTNEIFNNSICTNETLLQTIDTLQEVLQELLKCLPQNQSRQFTNANRIEIQARIQNQLEAERFSFDKAQKFLALYVQQPELISNTIQDLQQFEKFWELHRKLMSSLAEIGLNVDEKFDFKSCFAFFSLSKQLKECGLGISFKTLIPLLGNPNIRISDFNKISNCAHCVLTQLKVTDNQYAFGRKLLFPQNPEWQSNSINTLISSINTITANIENRAMNFTFFIQFLKENQDVEWQEIPLFIKFLTDKYYPHEQRLKKAFQKLGKMTGQGDSATEANLPVWKLEYENMVKLLSSIDYSTELDKIKLFFCPTETLSPSELRLQCQKDVKIYQKLYEKVEVQKKILSGFLLPNKINSFHNTCIHSTFIQNLNQLTFWKENESKNQSWSNYRKLYERAKELGLDVFIEEIKQNLFIGTPCEDILRKRFLLLWLDSFQKRHTDFCLYKSESLDNIVAQFQHLDQLFIQMNRDRVRANLLNISSRPVGGCLTLTVPMYEIKTLKHEASKIKRHLRLRQLFTKIPNLLLQLKPCMMMSPSAVSMYLGGQTGLFDVVIFDEASQLYPWDAINAIYRGKQIVVAGDDKQLPPTSYFTTVLEDFEDEESEIDAGKGGAGTGGFARGVRKSVVGLQGEKLP